MLKEREGWGGLQDDGGSGAQVRVERIGPRCFLCHITQRRYPSAPLNWDTNTGNTFIGPMCHHSRVPCICMGLSENIQSPICPGQANLRIMNHMWCVSDMQPESSPDVSTGLLPVLEKNSGFSKRNNNSPSRKTKKRSQQTFAAMMSKT